MVRERFNILTPPGLSVLSNCFLGSNFDRLSCISNYHRIQGFNFSIIRS